MSFYRWRFRISLAALKDSPPARRPGGNAADRLSVAAAAERVSPSWLSAFLMRIGLPRQRSRGIAQREPRQSGPRP
jgi:hypothetical protein